MATLSHRFLIATFVATGLCVSGCSFSATALIHPQSALCLEPVIKGKPADYRPTAWSIGILHGATPFSLNLDGDEINPVMSPHDVTDRTARFVADPFMLHYHDRWLLFFEVMNCGTEQGDIGYAESRDLRDWRYKGIVLDEAFHLSYPYVFEYEGSHYMLPETRQANEIRLYKAVSFPSNWRMERNLIKGNFADPSIIKYKDRWWIFAVEGGYSLAVFYSDSLFGPWTKHPHANFFPDDKSKTRPGGRLIEYNGKIVRFAQDNSLRYGHKVRAFEVDVLTPTEYSEHEVVAHPVLSPGGTSWREIGMHHLDAHQLTLHEWIAAVDGSGY